MQISEKFCISFSVRMESRSIVFCLQKYQFCIIIVWKPYADCCKLSADNHKTLIHTNEIQGDPVSVQCFQLRICKCGLDFKDLTNCSSRHPNTLREVVIIVWHNKDNIYIFLIIIIITMTGFSCLHKYYQSNDVIRQPLIIGVWTADSATQGYNIKHL